MTVLSSPSDFEYTWRKARSRKDLRKLTDVALDNYDSDTIPPWLHNEVRDICDSIARDLSQNLDRQDDSEAGVMLVQLASLLGPAGCMFSILGLAYHCMQPSEHGGRVNPKIPSLLDSLLPMLDFMPHGSWPSYVMQWRELAIRRVEGLVRADIARQIDDFRDQYADAVLNAEMIYIYDAAEPSLDFIRSKLTLLFDFHHTLQKYVPLMEHRGEKADLLEDLRLIEVKIDAGRDVLNMPRR